MTKTVALGGLSGGVTLFVWGFVSWMLIPWHDMTLERFENETTVEAALKANAPTSGVYVLPNLEGKSSEEMQGLKGTFAFATVQLDWEMSMGPQMVIHFLGNCVAAGFATWLLLKTTVSGFVSRVRYVKLIAIVAWLACILPMGIWWKFSASFLLINFVDLLIGWGLAGAVIALVVGRSQTSTS